VTRGKGVRPFGEHVGDLVPVYFAEITSLYFHPARSFGFRHQVLAPVFGSRHLERMEQIIRDACADVGCARTEFNGEAKHVHLLVSFSPTVAIPRPVNSLKGVSPHHPRQEFPKPGRRYWWATRRWPGSYLADSAGGAPLSVLRHYIEQPPPPDPAHLRPSSPRT
jgi:putative transposase